MLIKKQKIFVVAATVGIVGLTAGYLLSKADLFSHSEQIQKVRENENHLFNLIQNQTAIIDSTNNVVKDIDDYFETETNKCFNYLDIVNKNLETNIAGKNDMEIRIGMSIILNKITKNFR